MPPSSSGDPHEFTAELWRWEARSEQTGGWTFVSVPEDLSDEIETLALNGRGFGSVRVEVRAGGVVWRTSVFPDKRRGCYVLPVKKAVLTKLGAGVGDRLTLLLSVVEDRPAAPP